jgi:murein DD-endopeptidase MepM/ murein hydrolase activator NlpD
MRSVLASVYSSFSLRHGRPRFWILAVASCVLITSLTVTNVFAQTGVGTEVARSQLTARANWKYASFPVEEFLAYTSPFGYRTSPTGGSREFHRGLDIAAPDGSYVRNWWSGEVVELSDHTACGTLVAIQSGSWRHIYCHLKGKVVVYQNRTYLDDRAGGVTLTLGQRIPTGARIGRVGMTGRTTGPHLHWGLKYGSEYVDPADVLREMHRQQTASR